MLQTTLNGDKFICPKCEKEAKRGTVVVKSRKLKDGSVLQEATKRALVCECGVIAHIEAVPNTFIAGLGGSHTDVTRFTHTMTNADAQSRDVQARTI